MAFSRAHRSRRARLSVALRRLLGATVAASLGCGPGATDNSPPAYFELRVTGAVDTVLTGRETAVFTRAATEADPYAAPGQIVLMLRLLTSTGGPVSSFFADLAVYPGGLNGSSLVPCGGTVIQIGHPGLPLRATEFIADNGGVAVTREGDQLVGEIECYAVGDWVNEDHPTDRIEVRGEFRADYRD